MDVDHEEASKVVILRPGGALYIAEASPTAVRPVSRAASAPEVIMSSVFLRHSPPNFVRVVNCVGSVRCAQGPNGASSRQSRGSLAY